MRLPGPFVAVGALGLAVLAVSVVAVWMSINHVRAMQAIAVRATITINGTDNTFAPPPSSAVPAMTARQAWDSFSAGDRNTAIPPGTTVQLGLLTSPIGPYCGVECDNWIVKNGIAYRALNQLVFGYSWLAFPHRHLPNRNWIFLDASTGKMIIGVLSREPGSSGAPRLSPRLGTVSGLASPCVGAAKPGKASVTVYAKREGKIVGSRRVVLTRSPGNPYKLTLAPGIYIISAPKARLPARTVRVRAGRTETVNFLPSCK